jgi:hypothetical protein
MGQPPLTAGPEEPVPPSCGTGAGPGARTGSFRNAKDTGLRNLPLHGYEQNQIWCEIVALAGELLAWMQVLAFTGSARRWEPKRLRLRIFAVAGRLVRGVATGRALALAWIADGRRRWRCWPWRFIRHKLSVCTGALYVRRLSRPEDI